jgi:uncharacterized protein YkwD
MLKPGAAVFLLLTALLSAAFSQNNSSTIERKFQVAGYARTREPRAVVAAAGSVERQAFDLINMRRAEAGLSILAWNDGLAQVARSHSQDMADKGYFSHRGSDGSMVDDRADKFGLSNWTIIGENIAFTRGYADAAAFAVDRWMESVGHRKNLLDQRWNETGVGVAILPDGTYYFTQVFLLRD